MTENVMGMRIRNSFEFWQKKRTGVWLKGGNRVRVNNIRVDYKIFYDKINAGSGKIVREINDTQSQ